MNIGHDHIGDIFRVLGSRQQRTPLESTNTPFMFRSTWSCGCAVDYIDAEVGPFDWSRCADHRDGDDSAPRRAAFNWSGFATPNP
jgi:hypothetical protein